MLVSIQRGPDMLIPRGDIRLQTGDVVTALCQREYADELRIWMNSRDC